MHCWQDYVLAISFLAFNVALLPSVLSKNKPAIGTRLMTAAFLIPGLIVYFSLRLWYSVVMTTVNLLLWLTLFMQKYRQAAKRA